MHNLQEEKRFYNLDIVGDGPLREKIRSEISKLKKPDLILIYGDTDSTLAGAITARKKKY